MGQAESASTPADEQHEWLASVTADLARLQATIKEAISAEVRQGYPSSGKSRYPSQLMAATLIAQVTQALLNDEQDLEKTDAIAYIRLQTVLYAQAAVVARMMAETYAITGVRRGKLSRVQAAEILGVHQGTIARWLKDAKHDPSTIVDRWQEYSQMLHLNADKQTS